MPSYPQSVASLKTCPNFLFLPLFHFRTYLWVFWRVWGREIDVKHQIVVQITITCVNTWEFFTPMELKKGGGQSVDLNISIQNILMTMRAMWGLFKSLTNFNLIEFEELAQLVVPPSLVMRGPPRNHTTFPSNHPSWPHNKVCSASYCIWNMIMSPNMMHFYGIGARVQ
jgi:hypothetical protein